MLLRLTLGKLPLVVLHLDTLTTKILQWLMFLLYKDCVSFLLYSLTAAQAAKLQFMRDCMLK